jgi:hypothetical protein
MVKLVDHVRLRRPQAAREGDELSRREGLRAHAEHLVVVEDALDLAKARVRQRLRQIDAVDLGSEAVAERSYVEHGLVGAIIAPSRHDEYWVDR